MESAPSTALPKPARTRSSTELDGKPDYWETCSNDTLAKTEVPGTGTSTVQPECFFIRGDPGERSLACPRTPSTR